MSLSPSIYAGIDFNDRFKLETFYIQTNESKINNNTGLAFDTNGNLVSSGNKNSFPIQTNYKIKTQTFGFDFKPYRKLKENLVGYLIFGVNYSRIEFDHKVSVNIKLPQYNYSNVLQAESKKSFNKILPSIGIGLEYFATPNLSLRTQFKYSRLLLPPKDKYDGAYYEFNGYSNLNFGTAYYF